MTGGKMMSQNPTPPRRRRFPAAALLCLTALAGCASGGKREVVSTAGAAGAIGPYSQAVWAGNTLYLSGQIGIDPATGQLVPGGFEAEAKRALDNCCTILSAAGLTLADVVQVQVFLADMADYAALNAVYALLPGAAAGAGGDRSGGPAARRPGRDPDDRRPAGPLNKKRTHPGRPFPDRVCLD
jgi:2-iminobutanoate/2-iminopropanoate deaminase